MAGADMAGCADMTGRMGAARLTVEKNATANRAKPIKQRWGRGGAW
jgi:hypothetical protein